MGLIHVPVAIRRVASVDGVYRAQFLVDTGATDSMAPASELRRIGVTPVGSKTYELADGARHEYAFGLARIELMGEVTAGRILFGPDGVEPLLGVTALESMGITVDPASGTLRRLPAIPLKPLAATARRGFRARGQRVEAASGICSTFTVSCTAGE
jgi:clan AA aspartic protease